MKESYFTPGSLDQTATELYHQVAEISRIKELKLRPTQSALLVLDMQAYFLDPTSHAYVPSARAILDGILQMVDAYETHRLPIIFSKHVNTTENAGMMSVWWKDLITSESCFQEIIPEIDTAKGVVIRKSQYDAFFQTNLEEILRAKGVTQVVTCGVMTHLCCETTARSAFMRGFEVFFPVDGTATYNLAYHRASLTNLSHGFVSITFIREILDAIRGGHGS